jgi:hypothetical protein
MMRGIVAVVVASAVGGLTACGSNGNATPAPTPTPSFDQAAARTQITANWEKFFSKNTPLAAKAAYLQNGDKATSAIQTFANNPIVGKLSSTVNSVSLVGTTNAKVTYSLSLSGAPVMSNGVGTAVYQNGAWKVSDATLCGLLALAGVASKVSICA